MLSMTQQNDIRKLYFEQGNNISQISKITGNDRKTIRKYIEIDDWSPKPEVKKEEYRESKLDPFKSTIDSWLEEDKKFKKKQRHTAKRVYVRLCEKFKTDFDCSYRTVASYVAERKKQIFSKSVASLPLEHIAGEAQVDFGEAEFFENGTRITGKYLSVDFPHSNMGYLQLFHGETLECLMQGLINIFNHIGGVPKRMWFDNASSMVSTILKDGERTLTEGFIRFKKHFGFEAAFCNAAKGQEKGAVENKVGYLRRNLLVPVPQFLDIHKFNKELLGECEKDALRGHYKKETYISELFKEDMQALLVLPNVNFEASRYEFVKTDAYGKFKLNQGIHQYSTSPKYAKSTVQICITAFSVIVLDESLRTVVEHKRLYGNTKKESMLWIPYLEQLSYRPAALKYTGIYQMLPDPLKNHLEKCDRSERGIILKTLSEMTKKDSFDSAVKAFSDAEVIGALDKDSLLAIHNRILMPDFKLSQYIPECVPDLPPIKLNIDAYDRILKGLNGGNND